MKEESSKKNTRKTDLRDFTSPELASALSEFDVKPYRSAQIYDWLFVRGVDSIDEMTNISKELREKLAECFTLFTPPPPSSKKADDGTEKFALSLSDGSRIESVIIRESDRVTLCVSTQTGCALGCSFCLTGSGGPGRNLTLSEMALQYITARRLLSGDEHITNVVLMGMGEPLLNFDNVIKFTELLIDPKGFAMAPRRVTVSTAGIVPEIKRFGREGSVNLAVSINATTEAVRTKIMPINKKYPLSELLECLRSYPVSKRRFITIEYVLLGGVNDSEEDAERLAKLLRGIKCKVNLIPFNPHPGSTLNPPSTDAVGLFMDRLCKRGYTVVVRQSKGSEISAACGQLASADGRGAVA